MTSTMGIPKQIILVRHGQSEGNAYRPAYTYIPNHMIKLTNTGHVQAFNTGVELNTIIDKNKLFVYYSPYSRTVETMFEVLHGMGVTAEEKEKIQFQEDYRIRERDMGNFQDFDMATAQKTRENYSMFYYRFPDGESGPDVCNRMKSFIDSLKDDINNKFVKDSTVLIVSHGAATRYFLKEFYNLTVEQYLAIEEPDNAGKFILTQVESKKILPISYLSDYYEFNNTNINEFVNLLFDIKPKIKDLPKKLSDFDLQIKDLPKGLLPIIILISNNKKQFDEINKLNININVLSILNELVDLLKKKENPQNISVTISLTITNVLQNISKYPNTEIIRKNLSKFLTDLLSLISSMKLDIKTTEAIDKLKFKDLEKINIDTVINVTSNIKYFKINNNSVKSNLLTYLEESRYNLDYVKNYILNSIVNYDLITNNTNEYEFESKYIKDQARISNLSKTYEDNYQELIKLKSKDFSDGKHRCLCGNCGFADIDKCKDTANSKISDPKYWNDTKETIYRINYNPSQYKDFIINSTNKPIINYNKINRNDIHQKPIQLPIAIPVITSKPKRVDMGERVDMGGGSNIKITLNIK